jgi:hypothetical protein
MIALVLAPLQDQQTLSEEDRQTLREATLFLWETGAHCEAVRRSLYGSSRSNRSRTDKEKARELWLRASAAEWRARNTGASQSRGWRRLWAQAKKRTDFVPWPNPEALRAWANRKGIGL